MRTSTAALSTTITCLLSILFVQMLLAAQANSWRTQVLSELSVAATQPNLESLNPKTVVVSSSSDVPFIPALVVSPELGSQARPLNMNDAEERRWAYGWLAAERSLQHLVLGQSALLLGRTDGQTTVIEVPMASIPSPELSPLALIFLITFAMLWIGWIKLKPSSTAVLMGGLLYLACLMWVIFQAFYGAIEQSALLTGGASFDAGARDIMLVSAAALVPVVINLWLGVRSQGQGSAHRGAYTYLAPAIVGMAVLVFIPFVLGVGLAFFRHENGVFHWVGLHNFLVILSNEGLSFTHPLSFYFTLGVTILWTAINVLLHASFGLLLALLLNSSDLKFKGVYRVLLIVPWAVPSYITALIWHGMFESNGGVINRVLIEVGLSEVAWFDGFWSAFSANVVTNTWLGFPFMMVVSLGALQSIPQSLYEAATVDGANRWQCFRFITLPMLRPTLMPALILGGIWTFNMFNVIYLVSGGAPSNQTDILITEAYRWAFEKDRYGYAAAYSLLIFFILVAYSWLTQRVVDSEGTVTE